MLRKKLKRRKGQGMTEYIIIVALIAIAAIGVVSLFGDNIRALFAASDKALNGEENVAVKTKTAKKQLYQHRNLKNFSQNNNPK
ncbi:MAG: hypothetical protein D6806_00710 [Deltaproteobacteria bacterium]|nr:MAG: hypothetical protein D6806_00710 [Deltaproteobacteria bacterium]